MTSISGTNFFTMGSIEKYRLNDFGYNDFPAIMNWNFGPSEETNIGYNDLSTILKILLILLNIYWTNECQIRNQMIENTETYVISLSRFKLCLHSTMLAITRTYQQSVLQNFGQSLMKCTESAIMKFGYNEVMFRSDG